MNNKTKSIFKAGSTTYYYSSIFFPDDVKQDIFTLYAFVRTADNYVDTIPPQRTEFNTFYENTLVMLENKTTGNDIIDNFGKLCKKRNFKKAWIIAFLEAMKSDLSITTYKTFEDLEKYIYGSAEVIGLMMAQILELSAESHEAARLQGKAMQLINFVRDINEDIHLNRIYIPAEDLKKFHLKSPNINTTQNSNLEKLLLYEIARYKKIQKQAENGYKYIPKKYLVPIKTAADLYNWTAEEIKKNPEIIFQKKVKPSKWRVFATAIKNYLYV